MVIGTREGAARVRGVTVFIVGVGGTRMEIVGVDGTGARATLGGTRERAG